MDVSAKHEGNQLELALKGELDHHGAKGIITPYLINTCKYEEST